MAFFKLLWLLATICGGLISVDTASVPTALSDRSIHNNTAINLPNGFDSQATPMNPLLYPFATADMPLPPPALWQPMLGINGTPILTQHSLEFPPVLQDRILTAPTAPPLSLPAPAETISEEEGMVGGPVLESIVYGTWKPEQIPVQPQQMFELSSRNDSDFVEENVANDRIDDRLMAILSGQQHDLPEQFFLPKSRQSTAASSAERKYDDGYSSAERKNDDVYGKKPITKKYGRQKIPKQQETQNSSEIKTGIAVINVNISDPHLLAMAKQINHSAEITTFAEAVTQVQATHSTWMPMASAATTPSSDNGSDESTTVALTQDTTTAPKNWPTDFEHSSTAVRRTTTPPPPPPQSNYNIRGDSTDGPPQALSGGFSIPESLLPQMPFNITKMGVPYEHQNSSEEPTICVPLTVREESLVNTPGSAPETVNVERVYCFPLPSAEERDVLQYSKGNGSATLTLGTEEAKVNVLSDFDDEAIPPSAATNIGHINGLGLFIFVCFSVLRYHPN